MPKGTGSCRSRRRGSRAWTRISQPRRPEILLGAAMRVDVLVHSAGSDHTRPVRVGRRRADLDRHVPRSILRAPFVLTQALLPRSSAPRGQVVFINSSAALRASADNVALRRDEAGLKAFADGLRDEVNPDRRQGAQRLRRTDGDADAGVRCTSFEGRRIGRSCCCSPRTWSTSVLARLGPPGRAREVTDVEHPPDAPSCRRRESPRHRAPRLHRLRARAGAPRGRARGRRARHLLLPRLRLRRRRRSSSRRSPPTCATSSQPTSRDSTRSSTSRRSRTTRSAISTRTGRTRSTATAPSRSPARRRRPACGGSSSRRRAACTARPRATRRSTRPRRFGR